MSYIFSRIKQRTALLEEWLTVWETFIPLRGEQCIIIIPSKSADASIAGLPYSDSVRHMSKTGDGETTLLNLPWDQDIGNITSILSDHTEQIAQLTSRIDTRKFFVGTQAEYTAANSQGLIEIGTVVFLTDDDSTDVSFMGTSSLLGVGVLGQMILG